MTVPAVGGSGSTGRGATGARVGSGVRSVVARGAGSIVATGVDCAPSTSARATSRTRSGGTTAGATGGGRKLSGPEIEDEPTRTAPRTKRAVKRETVLIRG